MADLCLKVLDEVVAKPFDFSLVDAVSRISLQFEADLTNEARRVTEGGVHSN